MKKTYWDHAGDAGYLQTMYKSASVGEHILRRTWSEALRLAREIGVKPDARVMDLGCGDGAFANKMLAPNFKKVEGFELSENAIARANTNKTNPAQEFTACDITTLDYAKLGRYDAVFMIGILHHVKSASPAILKSIRGITDKVIVLEPNGNHIVRKLLEKTATYKAAGEDSFRKSELFAMFEAAGFTKTIHKQINLFPNFTPEIFYRAFLPLEPVIEKSALLNGLCTNGIYAFEVR